MDFTTVATAFSNLGFPVLVSIILFWQINKQNDRYLDSMEAMRTAITNNTEAINELRHELEIRKS